MAQVVGRGRPWIQEALMNHPENRDAAEPDGGPDGAANKPSVAEVLATGLAHSMRSTIAAVSCSD
jgi:hypothetical protein